MHCHSDAVFPFRYTRTCKKRYGIKKEFTLPLTLSKFMAKVFVFEQFEPDFLFFTFGNDSPQKVAICSGNTKIKTYGGSITLTCNTGILLKFGLLIF